MTTPHSENPIRILVADDELNINDSLVEFLISHGFQARHARNGRQVAEILQDKFKPDFVLYDLMLPELNAFEFLKQAKQDGLLKDDRTKVLIASRQNTAKNVSQSVKAGAADFIVKPMTNQDFLARLVLHLQKKNDVVEFRARTDTDLQSAQYFMHLTDLILRESLKDQAPLDTLHNLTGMLALALGAVRVSLVRADIVNMRGRVYASNDKRSIGGLEINLIKYPEIQYVLASEKQLALENMASDPTMQFVAKQHKEISFNSMVVSPVRIRGQLWGVVSARMGANKEKLGDFEVRFAQMIAHVMGMVARLEPSLMAPLELPTESTINPDIKK